MTPAGRPLVAVASAAGSYPGEAPFDPDERYPEYPGPVKGASPNPAYRAVRDALALLRTDEEHFGTPSWNPLGHIVKPGDRVFIKPNLVTHEFGRKLSGQAGDLFAVITHPSVVRAIADYVAIALRGRGEILIGDNPSIDADFSRLLAATSLPAVAALYPQRFGVPCTVLDLRPCWCADLADYGVEERMQPLAGDPRGDTVVNLGEGSFFAGCNPLLFRGVYDNRWETIRHHHGDVHEYGVSNSIYESDVFVSVPKLKTHHKVGVTLNVKGLVGTCSRKNYLVHWRIGVPACGGDEYPTGMTMAAQALVVGAHVLGALLPAAVVRRAASLWGAGRARLGVPAFRGAWSGNDTCWRMAADLYQVLMTRPRRCFTVIDGITAGEGNGPFCPSPKPARTVIASEDLLLADCAAVRLMGFDLVPIKHLTALLDRQGRRLDAVEIAATDRGLTDLLRGFPQRRLAFAPPTGWEHLRPRSETS